MMVLLPTV